MRGCAEINLEGKTKHGSILIPKIVNYGDEALNHLWCYVLATEKPVERDSLSL